MNWNESVYQSLFTYVALGIPLKGIVWLYVNMLIRLWRGTSSTQGPGPARDKQSRGQENKRRVTRMIFVVVIVFAICWTPLHVILVLKTFGLYNMDSGALVVLQIITQVRESEKDENNFANLKAYIDFPIVLPLILGWKNRR